MSTMVAMGAATISGCVAAALAREGFELPDDLAIAGPAGAVESAGDVAVDGPGDLGRLHAAATTADARRRRGAWYTPGDIAERLARAALECSGAIGADRPVLDPACGAGSLLLAAADVLADGGRDPADVVAVMRGVDLDPTAAALAEAALWWWGMRRGVDVRPTIAVDDGLSGALPRAGAVVANPPFRTQLRTATADDEAQRAALGRRFGSLVRPYTDTAWLFLLAAVEAAADGAGLAVLQPVSVLAARDAGPVRDAIAGLATVERIEVLADHDFDAEVDLCIPVLRKERSDDTVDWTGSLADAMGVPASPIELSAPSATGRLEDLATVRAGFRDEFYGLVDAVSEGGDGPRLVTVGSVDPFRRLDRPVRFAGQRWRDPRVDPSRATDRASWWVDLQHAPKIVVATQTRVVEAVADPAGEFVAGVPAIVVLPRDPTDLWRLLAVLSSPVVAAAVVRATAGSGMARAVCRPTAAILSQLPLPAIDDHWDAAAHVAQQLSTEGLDAAMLSAFARCATAMYEVHGSAADQVETWWLDAVDQRERLSG